MTVDDLIAFLRAMLADDEAYAHAAFGDHNDAGHWYEQWSGALNVGEEEDLVLTNDAAVSRFMERHDPARVLREVEVKRRIVAEHYELQGWCVGCGALFMRRAGDCPELRHLATVYAGHPDYRAEWRP